MSKKSLAGLRNKRKSNFMVEYDEPVSQKDFPLIKERIITNSLSNEWDDARREWEFDKIIFEDDFEAFDHFTDKCELCNHVGLKRNFEIFNPGTGKRFLVGSTCIKKFLLLKGAESQEQSAAIFDFEVKQMLAARKLQSLLPKILTEPSYYEANTFRNASEDILGSLDNILIKQHIWEKYIKLLFGPNPPKKSIKRVKTVLFQPSKMFYKKVKDLSTGEEEGRWASKIKVKANVETTLVRSKEDRPDKRY